MQNVTSADSKTIDGCDDRLRHGTNLFLYVEYIQTGNAVLTDIPAMTFHIHISTGTESGVASSGQDDDTNIRTLPANVKRIAHFGCRGGSEGITVTFAVDSDTGNTIVEIKQDFFIFFYLFPFSLC